MTTIARACPITIQTLESAGDGSAGAAAPFDIRSPHTLLLVTLPESDLQAIKFSQGNAGDVVEVLVVNRASTDGRLVIYDHEDNSIMGTALSNGWMSIGDYGVMKKILDTAYSSTSGHSAPIVGTWIGETSGPRFSAPSSS